MGVKIPRGKATPKKSPAEKAVDSFEAQLSILDEMKESWTSLYPDAAEALDQVKMQEDHVLEAMKEAKEAVREHGKTVGNFVLTNKNAAAHYDPSEVTSILKGREDGEKLAMELLKSGHGLISLDKGAVTWIAKNQKMAKVLDQAWRDKTPMTPSVKTPKL